MLRVQGMDHIVLNVADVERSVAFYGDVLGLGIERLDAWRSGAVPFPSVRLSEQTLIDLVHASDAAQRAGAATNLNHFCLVVEDEALEPIVEHLATHGVTVHQGPVPRWGARGTGTSIYFCDVDGNEIEVRTYAAPAVQISGSAPALRGAAVPADAEWRRTRSERVRRPSDG